MSEVKFFFLIEPSRFAIPTHVIRILVFNWQQAKTGRRFFCANYTDLTSDYVTVVTSILLTNNYLLPIGVSSNSFIFRHRQDPFYFKHKLGLISAVSSPILDPNATPLIMKTCFCNWSLLYVDVVKDDSHMLIFQLALGYKPELLGLLCLKQREVIISTKRRKPLNLEFGICKKENFTLIIFRPMRVSSFNFFLQSRHWHSMSSYFSL